MVLEVLAVLEVVAVEVVAVAVVAVARPQRHLNCAAVKHAPATQVKTSSSAIAQPLTTQAAAQ